MEMESENFPKVRVVNRTRKMLFNAIEVSKNQLRMKREYTSTVRIKLDTQIFASRSFRHVGCRIECDLHGNIKKSSRKLSDVTPPYGEKQNNSLQSFFKEKTKTPGCAQSKKNSDLNSPFEFLANYAKKVKDDYPSSLPMPDREAERDDHKNLSKMFTLKILPCAKIDENNTYPSFICFSKCQIINRK